MAEERGRTASTTTRVVEVPIEEPAARITPAKGSGEIPRNLLDEDKATREMDPAEFRALLAQDVARSRQGRSPTIPVTNETMQRLAAQTLRDDDDLAVPVASADRTQPHPRAAMEPLVFRELAQPPVQHPPAPRTNTRRYLLLVVLALAIAGALALRYV